MTCTEGGVHDRAPGSAARNCVMLLVVMLWCDVGAAAERHAGPGDYRDALAVLAPGDRLLLAPGEYRSGLPLHGIAGTATQPIVIDGARDGTTRFVARAGHNTVSLRDAAYVVVRNLTLDGRGLPVDAVKAEGDSRYAAHITLERLTIVGHGHDQQTVGISSKCPAWGWIVRDTVIVGAGTGMYFGDSDGTDPFVAGLIEGNRVLNPIGYALQIKHQNPWPDRAGLPPGRSDTIIRGNVFVKSSGGRAESPRPDVLVGAVPASGAGAQNGYRIYGNLFFDNDSPAEALLQADGNVAVYNNLFVNPRGDGLRVFPHHGVPRTIAIVRNTFVVSGIAVFYSAGPPGFQRRLEQNLIFAATPLQGELAGDNMALDADAARRLLEQSAGPWPALDLAPRRWLRAPRPLDEALRQLPGIELDVAGRRRVLDFYGACPPRGAADTRVCLPPVALTPAQTAEERLP